MAKKKTVIKVLVSGLVVVFIAAAVMLASIHGAFKTVAKPEIKEGEFDFALTYEVDGENKVIEGTYVCEFDGINRAIDGVGRRWNGYIKDHDDFTNYEIKKTYNNNFSCGNAFGKYGICHRYVRNTRRGCGYAAFGGR